MRKLVKLIPAFLLLAVLVVAPITNVYAADDTKTETTAEVEETTADPTTGKAMAAALAVGIGAAAGAIAMGFAISKSAESIARQPEAEGPIRTTLMLGLVFIETAIIYALLAAILIIFVL